MPDISNQSLPEIQLSRELTRIAAESLEIVQIARSLTISDQSEYAAADLFRRECIVEPRRQIAKDFKDPKKKAYDGHRAICALEQKYDAPFKAAQEIIDVAMDRFQQQQKQIREQEAAALLMSARIESERIAVEQAEQLLASGNSESVEEAEELLEAVAAGTMQLSTSTVPIVHNKIESDFSSYRSLPRFRVLDPSKIKPEFLMPDLDKIQSVVTEHKKRAEEIVGIGGIEYYEKGSIATKGAPK